MQKALNDFLSGFKNKGCNPLQKEHTVIPSKYLEKYKKDCSDETICEILLNLSYCNRQKMPQTIDEIKSTGNRELLKKIIFRLTKIKDVIKKANSPQIGKKHTRE